MPSPNLPTNVGSGTSSGHLNHHNVAHTYVNKLDTTFLTATLGQVTIFNGSTYVPAGVIVKWPVLYPAGGPWPALSTVPSWWLSSGKPIDWDSENDIAAPNPPEGRNGDYWSRKIT